MLRLGNPAQNPLPPAPGRTLPRSYVVARRESYLYPMAGALLMPSACACFTPSMFEALRIGFLFLLILLPAAAVIVIGYECSLKGQPVVVSLFRHIRPLPPGLVLGTDLEDRGFPVSVSLLVLLNLVVFFFAPVEATADWCFPPRGDSSTLHRLVSVFTSAFLHKDWPHLAGNMVFLWAFGSALEARIGAPRFLFGYFMSTVCAKALVFGLLALQADYHGSRALMERFHCIGASGAVAGVMGLFVVRCFFARIAVTFPLFFVPYVSVLCKVPGILPVAFYFALDVAGSMVQFHFTSSLVRVNFWSHVGGYIGGMGLGYLMRLNRAALTESVESKIRRLSRHPLDRQKAVTYCREILSQDPENTIALTACFDLNRLPDPGAASAAYARLMAVLVKRDPPGAVRLFRQHQRSYGAALNGRELVWLGRHFFRHHDLEAAMACLGHATATEGPWRAKALLMEAAILRHAGRLVESRRVLRSLMDSFPETPFAREASVRLTAMLPAGVR